MKLKEVTSQPRFQMVQAVRWGRVKIKKIKLIYLLPVVVFMVVIGLWEGIVLLFRVPQYLLPPPYEILQTMVTMRGSLSWNFLITSISSVGGLLLGGGLGIVTGILFAYSRPIEISLYPYAVALKTLPIIALAPLLTLWFGNGIPARVIIAALISFFPCIVNTTRGLRSVDEEWLDLMDCLGAKKWQVFKDVRLKFALPYIFAALKVSATLSVLGAIVGEFVAPKDGLGSIILIALYQIETDTMYAGIIASGILGIMLFALVSAIESKVLFWHRSDLEEV